MSKQYAVKREVLVDLIAARLKLYALENGGVDNWAWYEDSINDYLSNFTDDTKEEEEESYYTFEELAQQLVCDYIELDL